MNCPKCGSDSTVIDSRPVNSGKVINRRRVCRCGARWSTKERRTGTIDMVGIPHWMEASDSGKATIVMPTQATNLGANGTQTLGVKATIPSVGGRGGPSSAPIPSELTPDLSDLRLDLFQEVDPARAKPKKPRRQETPAFQAFYAAYPRKTARDRAWLNWESVGAEAHAAEIMAALGWQVPLVFSKRTFDKIPHPGTWLTDGCWKDERPRSVTEPLRMMRPSGPPVAIAELAGQRARQLEEAVERARIEDAERFKQQRQLAEGKS